MIFNRVDDYAELSECRRYSVCKVAVRQDHWIYEAWQTREHPDGPHMIGLYPSPAHARIACEVVEGGP